MSPDAPALRYYRALQDSWSGRFEFRIVDWTDLRRSTLAPGDKLSASVMGIAALLLGAPTMATTLEERTPGEFFHTTRVTKWGATVFTTTETIAISDDGRTFRMSGEQLAGGARTPVPYVAEGEIDETATRATYAVPWLGTMLVQRTQIVAEGLELSQETTWSRGKVLLRRASRA